MSTSRPGTRPFDLPAAQMSARQTAIYQRIEQGPRGRVPINLRIWLHNPDFADVVEPFGLYVSEHASITKRQKEIVILTGCIRWKAQFEWHMHVGHAKKAGLTEQQILAIRDGRAPGFDDPVEQATYELCAAFARGGEIPADVYEAAMQAFGHQGVSDLIGLAGLYAMISMTLNFYAVPAPAGSEGNPQL